MYIKIHTPFSISKLFECQYLLVPPERTIFKKSSYLIGKAKCIPRRFINVKKNVLHFHMTYELICTICIFSKQHFRLPIYVRFNQML